MEEGAALKRGVKRVADESNLSDDQRFTKRFNLLNLGPASGNSSSFYIPASSSPASNGASIPATSISELPERFDSDEHMSIDDTPERVYVHDLDAELAEIEANEPSQRLIFLPDIEKHFSRLPNSVLRQRRSSVDSNHEGQQLVLYEVPKSLTTEEGHDPVRKAILEARQRTRERAAEQTRQEEVERKYGHMEENHAVETAHGYSNGYVEGAGSDPDAMDVEEAVGCLVGYDV